MRQSWFYELHICRFISSSKHPYEVGDITPFPIKGIWGTERLGDLPKITQLVSGRARTRTQEAPRRGPALNPSLAADRWITAGSQKGRSAIQCSWPMSCLPTDHPWAPLGGRRHSSNSKRMLDHHNPWLKNKQTHYVDIFDSLCSNWSEMNWCWNSLPPRFSFYENLLNY